MYTEKSDQLNRMLAFCRSLDADVRYSKGNGSITILTWCDDGTAEAEEAARVIQSTLKEESARYPNIVCYCFDAYSTLIYVV